MEVSPISGGLFFRVCVVGGGGGAGGGGGEEGGLGLLSDSKNVSFCKQ